MVVSICKYRFRMFDAIGCILLCRLPPRNVSRQHLQFYEMLRQLIFAPTPSFQISSSSLSSDRHARSCTHRALTPWLSQRAAALAAGNRTAHHRDQRRSQSFLLSAWRKLYSLGTLSQALQHLLLIAISKTAMSMIIPSSWHVFPVSFRLYSTLRPSLIAYSLCFARMSSAAELLALILPWWSKRSLLSYIPMVHVYSYLKPCTIVFLGIVSPTEIAPSSV